MAVTIGSGEALAATVERGDVSGTRPRVRYDGETLQLPLPNGPTINFAYVAGPAGAKIELVERPGIKPGE